MAAPVIDVAPQATAAAVEQREFADLSIDKLDLKGMRFRAGTRKAKSGKRVPIFDRMSANVTEVITDAVVERTVEGASTLTVTIHDPEWELLESGLFDSDKDGQLDIIDVKLDKLWFRLVKVAPSGDNLVLTFEDREVALLRQHDKPRSVARKDKTRAQFVEMLVREVKSVRIKFYAPEKAIRQPVAKQPKAKNQKHPKERNGGLNPKQSLKIKGKRADASQRRNIELALRGADIEDADKKSRKALVLAGIAEGQFRTTATNPRSGAKGPWQLLPSTERNIGFKHTAIQKTARYFLTTGFTGTGKGAIDLARSAGLSSAAIANMVEGGGAGAAFYAAWDAEAEAILDAWGDFGGSTGGSTKTTRVKQYRFARGQDGEREDSWTAMQRLAADVNWRCFMRNGEVWFISEPRLLKQRPAAVITRDTEGVDRGTFGFDWDTGKRVKELSFDIHVTRWAFPPGSVIVIQKSGSANGRWIVHSISRSLYSDNGSVTLTKAIKPKPEPAAETTTGVQGDSSADTTADKSSVGKVYNRGVSISNKNMPYVWGGGHGKIGVPTGSPAGYDCSGYVSACLHAAGLLDNTLDSSGLMRWGHAGEGKEMTVWANAGHTFIEFKGKKFNYADTSRQAGGPAGPHMREGHRSTAGFTARHWPGT